MEVHSLSVWNNAESEQLQLGMMLEPVLDSVERCMRYFYRI
jgi:hypothetical protein